MKFYIKLFILISLLNKLEANQELALFVYKFFSQKEKELTLCIHEHTCTQEKKCFDEYKIIYQIGFDEYEAMLLKVETSDHDKIIEAKELQMKKEGENLAFIDELNRLLVKKREEKKYELKEVVIENENAILRLGNNILLSGWYWGDYHAVYLKDEACYLTMNEYFKLKEPQMKNYLIKN
jgi:hypothetical protein